MNLNAPQNNEEGREFWSYSLIREIEDGNVVFHYDGIAQAIVARSRATGVVWADEVVWAARGLSARSANIAPHSRPGWYLGLEGFQRLQTPVTLDAIREKAEVIRDLLNVLTEEVGKPLYFPFEMSSGRPMRPMQGYLFKLPINVLVLLGIDALGGTSPNVKPLQLEMGTNYRQADEQATVATRDPFAVDPALVERGVRGHATVQNRLATYLHSHGIEPRSPTADEPNYDVAWRLCEQLFVAEVKSLTTDNEEKQLRLGLGQVLRYAYQMSGVLPAVPVLVIERRPMDAGWQYLCDRLGVVLAWPDVFEERLRWQFVAVAAPSK